MSHPRTLGLEIADTGLLACYFTGEEPALVPLHPNFATSPGIAQLTPDTVLLGHDAAEQKRLAPQNHISDFWENLSAEPLAVKTNPSILTYAHLAHRQLSTIWNRLKEGPAIDRVAFALPDSWLAHDDRLGILLGIAQDLKMPLAALAPLSLAQLHQMPPTQESTGPCTHCLDLHLNRFTLTPYPLNANTTQLSLDKPEALPGPGLLAIIAQLYAQWAPAFLRATSFDVAESRSTEQALYNAIWTLFQKEGIPSDYSITLDFDGHRAEMPLSPEALNNSMQATLKPLLKALSSAQFQNATLGLTHRVAQLPGFIEALARVSNIRTVTFPRGSAAAGAARIASQSPVATNLAATPFIQNYTPETPLSFSAPTQARPTHRPTHLLHQAIAYSIQNMADPTELPPPLQTEFGFPWAFTHAEWSLPANKSFKLNQSPITGSFTPRTGDTLETEDGSESLTFIHCHGQ